MFVDVLRVNENTQSSAPEERTGMCVRQWNVTNIQCLYGFVQCRRKVNDSYFRLTVVTFCPFLELFGFS